jgi:SAM-dependent methyltransferase
MGSRDKQQRGGMLVWRETPRKETMMTRHKLASWLVAALCCCVLLVGCRNKSASAETGERSARAAKSIAQPSASHVAPPAAHSAHAHDAAHPPIDCPLRQQGIDPSHMKPFEDVEKYITFLERPDRARWQKPDEVVAALGLTGSETVVDLGAGSGYFAFRFAKALPKGRVIAADIEPEMIRHIHHKAMTEGVGNIEAKLIQPDGPSIPTDVDLVFVCDVLHHVSNRPAWLSQITAAMRSGARLALIEFTEGDLPQGPPAAMKIPRAELVKLVTDAGLVLADDRTRLLPYQTFLVFRKP